MTVPDGHTTLPDRIDLVAAITRVLGRAPADHHGPHVEPVEGDRDDWVGAAEAERRQRAYDDVMTERWGPQC